MLETSPMMHILVTQEFAREYGDQVRALVPGPCHLICFDPCTTTLPEGLDTATVAYVSLDLMGGMDEKGAHPRLRAFCAAIEQAGSLKWLHTQAAGIDRPVYQNALRRGVMVTTSSGATSETVAQTAITGMLAMARGVPTWVAAQANKVWAKPTREQWPRDIEGSHALVVGTGPIGQAIARILRAMNVQVTGMRRSTHPVPGFDRIVAFSETDGVLERSDWVFLACPLTDQTRGLVNEAFLARLPDHAHLINVARGEVIVDAAVQSALRSGTLAGYYSDVFAGEPLAEHSPWWDMPRTLISPHLAASAAGYSARTANMFLENLQRYVAREPLRNVVAAVSARA